MSQRAVRKTDPFVGLTEHPLNDGRRIVIAINYSPEPRSVALQIAAPWAVEEAWFARPPTSIAGLEPATGAKRRSGVHVAKR